MSRRLLQIIVAILAINALVGGGLYMVMGLRGLTVTGAKSVMPLNDSSLATLDYFFRALAGVWFGLGVMLGWLVFHLERETVLFRFACLAMFFMGVGRFFSVLSLGIGSNSSLAMTLELVVPLLLLVWQNKVAKPLR